MQIRGLAFILATSSNPLSALGSTMTDGPVHFSTCTGYWLLPDNVPTAELDDPGTLLALRLNLEQPAARNKTEFSLSL